MPTTNYNLPTIDENALANAVDAALKTVDDKIKTPASMQTITTWEQLKNYGAYAPTTELEG